MKADDAPKGCEEPLIWADGYNAALATVFLESGAEYVGRKYTVIQVPRELWLEMEQATTPTTSSTICRCGLDNMPDCEVCQ